MVSTDLGHEPWSDEEPSPAGPSATGAFVTIDGIDHYRIEGVDRIEPFLTTVVSDSDLWMFASSAGSLTAGRVDAHHAAFPYLPDDMIHRMAGSAGPVTAIARTVDGERQIWRPFHTDRSAGCTRSLAKSALGDRLVFEELHTDWQLQVRTTWAPSRSFGWVRRLEVTNLGESRSFEVLDGLLDVMPPMVDPGVEQGSSNLVNAFKRAELTDAPHQLATFNLESLITDRAEPGEALVANVVWSYGLDAPADLDSRALQAFLDGAARSPSRLVTGRATAYLLRGRLDLASGAAATSTLVIDAGLDHAALTATTDAIAAPGVDDQVAADLRAGSERLESLLAAADGMQSTADREADTHHLSNVLFNSMRGGVFPYGHQIPVTDLIDFIGTRNAAVTERQAAWLAALDDRLEVADLRRLAEATGDADLVRLVLEYLPLTFSRRHGDPSRPWNQFSIRVSGDDGTEILRYEGNWRDIFQNWEALLGSFPAYFSHVVAKFVNASSLDGYNPYRISREGVDWEVPEPGDPWGNIGYWGDHQVIYLLRLLEGWQRYEPDALASWMNRPVFVYADIPYRIADRGDMIDDPRNTITFLEERAAAIADREARLGSDGRLVTDDSGDLLRVGLAEKLLVPALSKMTSFVPGGGIWMNTQRPEWNDANNALAGPGLSMVTVYHLHRYLTFLRTQFVEQASLKLSSPTAAWLEELDRIYTTYSPHATDEISRRRMVEALGTSADAQTRRILAGARHEPTEIESPTVVEFIDHALTHLASTIDEGRRADGLVDSYNLISFPDAESAHVEKLGPMLEGQVAALSSGIIEPTQALATLDALYASDIYRSDLDTFMLYPVKPLASFAVRNLVTPGALPEEIVDRLPSVVTADSHGQLRFRLHASNAAALDALLDLDDASADDRAAIHAAYEATFSHASFTGRSGSMHGYEGIGSVYWHMVSKLLLAVQELYWTALDRGDDPEIAEQLAAAYRRVRAGLGFTKGPAEFGAFPIDCYSHTPAHSGAQQPGMTGQVKEEVLTRFGEIGLRVVDGRLRLQPGLLPDADLFGADGTDTAAFTFCSVPMVVQRGEADRVVCAWADGDIRTDHGSTLSTDASAAVFARTGRVREIRWTVAR